MTTVSIYTRHWGPPVPGPFGPNVWHGNQPLSDDEFAAGEQVLAKFLRDSEIDEGRTYLHFEGGSGVTWGTHESGKITAPGMVSIDDDDSVAIDFLYEYMQATHTILEIQLEGHYAATTSEAFEGFPVEKVKLQVCKSVDELRSVIELAP